MKREPTLLGLKLQHPRWVLLWSALLAAYYLFSMSRGMGFYDSPELAIVAEQLGLGHPPGQPLHTILGWLATQLLSFIDPLLVLNAFSALFAALSLIPATAFAEALARSHPKHSTIQYRVISPTLALLGMHASLWDAATRIEVYPLATFFALWAVTKLCATALEDHSHTRKRSLFAAGIGFGLSAATNPIIAIAGAGASLPRLAIGLLRRELYLRHIASLVGGGLIGLLPYLYVPLVSFRTDALVWGRPNQFSSLLYYFSGADFAHNRGITFKVWLDHAASLLLWSVQNGIAALFVFGFLGLSLFAVRRGLGRIFYWLLWLMLLSFIASNVVFATDVPDYLGYLATPLWISAMGSALLIAYCAQWRAFSAGLAVLCLCVVVFSSQLPLHERTRHHDRLADDLALHTLRDAPPNAIIIAEVDHWVGPLWYAQEQLDLRPDVSVIFYGLTSSSWYWQRLYQRQSFLKPFSLRGVGARTGRIHRFLAAQGLRPLQITSSDLAQRLNILTCPGTWMLDATRRLCEPPSNLGIDTLLENYAMRVGRGSPGSSGILAALAYERAQSLWQNGMAPSHAIDAALSGVPKTLRPQFTLSAQAFKQDQRVVKRPMPAFSFADPVASGSATRNLFLAAWFAQNVGETQASQQLLRRAADLGLREAQRAISED